MTDDVKTGNTGEEEMADCSQGVSQQAAEVNALNAKLTYDSAAQIQHQSLADNQEDARAWAQLKLRIATNAATVDHLVDMGVVSAGQTGITENQQSVTPIRTGSGDAIAAVPGVAADAVAASLGNNATLFAALVAQTVAALVPVVLNAAGGASTPSQTQPKPTA